MPDNTDEAQNQFFRDYCSKEKQNSFSPFVTETKEPLVLPLSCVVICNIYIYIYICT